MLNRYIEILEINLIQSSIYLLVALLHHCFTLAVNMKFEVPAALTSPGFLLLVGIVIIVIITKVIK